MWVVVESPAHAPLWETVMVSHTVDVNRAVKYLTLAAAQAQADYLGPPAYVAELNTTPTKGKHGTLKPWDLPPTDPSYSPKPRPYPDKGESPENTWYWLGVFEVGWDDEELTDLDGLSRIREVIPAATALAGLRTITEEQATRTEDASDPAALDEAVRLQDWDAVTRWISGYRETITSHHSFASSSDLADEFFRASNQKLRIRRLPNGDYLGDPS